MLDFLLIMFVLYLTYSRISSLKKDLETKIEDLENNVQYLNDNLTALKKQLKRSQEIKKPVEATEAAKVSETEKVAKIVLPEVDKPEQKTEKTEKAPIEAPDYSSLNFSQPAKKDDEAAPTRVDKKHEWLSAAIAEIPAREKATKPVSSVAEATGTDSEPIKKEPEKRYKPEAGFAGGGSKDPGNPDLPPEGPEWGDRWQKLVQGVDWEQFTGANLFAWLGGIALFIGAGFFVKYSIDKNLISPILRLVIGALVGLGMIGASCRFERGRYDTMRQTFASGGIGVLYSVFFAATLYYEYLPKPAGFVTLVIVSAAAFVLALFHRGVSISILGGIGAYLTPLLVTTGSGNLFSLFAYLSIVNAGIFQVMKRLDSRLLLPFAAIGTMISLAFGTLFSLPEPDAALVAMAWIGNLMVFAVFLDRSGYCPSQSRASQWTGILTFLSLPLVALFLVLLDGSCSPMAMMAAGVTAALVLSLRNKVWMNLFIPYCSVTFIVAAVWTFARFDEASSIWAFLAFFIYGLAGGAGPIVLLHKNGVNANILRWLKIFPVAVSLLLLMSVIITPHISYLFWPMAIGLQVIGIIISMLFGGLLQLMMMAAALVIAGIIWLSAVSPLTASAGIYGMIMLAGAAIVLVVFWCLKRAVYWSAALNIEGETKTAVKLTSSQAEWMSATPIIGIFVLLATTFALVTPLNPNPGMVTLLCIGAITLTMARRMNFAIMIAVTLFSAAFAQAFWALRPDLTSTLYLHSILWSILFFAFAIAVPFVVYRSFSTFKIAWMAWPIFELAQGIFLVFAADHFWGRDIAGWVPFMLAFLKLPIVAHLLKLLTGQQERNSILACHGGVLLFYVSATPILLLEKGWIGLVLVVEAIALLWLNRRVEHPGLRKVSVIMAPVGLFLLLSFLPQMKGPDSVIIFNSAVMSVLAASLALFAGVRLAPWPDDRLGEFSISRYFLWLAVGTAFYLVNLMVADVFAGSLVATGSTLKFATSGNLLQSIVYVFLWALFGAVLWRKQDLPMGIRIFGIVLVVLASLWLVLFPIDHSLDVALMSPFLNLGLLAYLPVMLVLLFLFLKEPWGESSISIKNMFLAMLLITGFLAIKVIKSTILQPGLPLDIFMDKTANMAVGSAAGWILYGLAMLIWPKRLDRPFRLAGLILLILGLGKTLLFPFRYSAEFGAMQPLMNRPTALFAFCTVLLIWLTWRKFDESWPVEQVQAKPLFATMLAIGVFCFMNIEIASVFGHEGRPFSLLTRGSLAHQLGYSLGWLVYAIALLVAGIRWNQVYARQAALILVLITCFKIFLKDLWSLGQLYRVASFIGLAVVLMLVSYLYQRFLSNTGDKANEKN